MGSDLFVLVPLISILSLSQKKEKKRKHSEFIGQVLLLHLYLVCTDKLLNIECRSSIIYITITIWPVSIQTENKQHLSKEQTFELFDNYIHINLVLHKFFSITLY